jgi:hypothetical protein
MAQGAAENAQSSLDVAVDVDYSTLKAVAACDTKVALRHVLGLTKPRDEDDAAMAAGTAAHEALAAFLAGAPAPFALATFIAEYQPVADALNPGLYPWQQRLTLDNTRAIMERWFETHPLDQLPFRVRPDLIEVGFRVPLVPGLNLIGRCDAIVERDGDLYVLDHKTTGRIDTGWRHQYRLDAQMTTYVFAASATLGQRVRGIFINGIEFARVPTTDRTCPKHRLPYAECGAEHATFEVACFDRSDDELSAWQTTTQTLARRYKSLLQSVHAVEDVPHLLQQGTYNGSCRFCGFKEFCEHERRAPQLLVPSRWNPLARK